jgi:transposase
VVFFGRFRLKTLLAQAIVGDIDRFLDLKDLRAHLAAFYSHTGRPSVDPELMLRMLIVGYCFGIRSERHGS